MNHDFPTTPTGCVITSTGIVIGGGVSRSEQMSFDAELIQAALIAKPRTLGDRLLDAFDAAPYPTIVCIILLGLIYAFWKWVTT